MILKRIITYMVMVSLTFSGFVYAIGLGDIKVYSMLNEPFNAEITIIDSDNVDENLLLANLASSVEFSRAGLERFLFLSKFNFNIVRYNNETSIHITSIDSIKYPTIEFLVELLWPEGRLIKTYGVILELEKTGKKSVKEFTLLERKTHAIQEQTISKFAESKPTEVNSKNNFNDANYILQKDIEENSLAPLTSIREDNVGKSFSSSNMQQSNLNNIRESAQQVQQYYQNQSKELDSYSGQAGPGQQTQQYYQNQSKELDSYSGQAGPGQQTQQYYQNQSKELDPGQSRATSAVPVQPEQRVSSTHKNLQLASNSQSNQEVGFIEEDLQAGQANVDVDPNKVALNFTKGLVNLLKGDGLKRGEDTNNINVGNAVVTHAILEPQQSHFKIIGKLFVSFIMVGVAGIISLRIFREQGHAMVSDNKIEAEPATDFRDLTCSPELNLPATARNNVAETIARLEQTVENNINNIMSLDIDHVDLAKNLQIDKDLDVYQTRDLDDKQHVSRHTECFSNTANYNDNETDIDNDTLLYTQADALKLKLAQQYIEIQDLNSAQSLLTEIMNTAVDPESVDMAKKILEAIS